MTKTKLTATELQAARERRSERARTEPRADRVAYDARRQMIVLDLHGGAIVAVPVATIRELHGATINQLKSVRAAFGGESLTIDALDVDISIPGLLRDLIGLTSAASLLGKKGGSAKSAAKAAAVRENGKRGGRPRKTAEPSSAGHATPQAPR
jgi:hypothetical protein